MDLKKVEKPYREALAVHEALRRLGFEPEEIYVGHNNFGQFWVQLESQGKKFIADCGYIHEPSESVDRRWKEIVAAVVDGSITNESFDLALRDSEVYRNSASFVSTLKRKGFEFPNLSN